MALSREQAVAKVARLLDLAEGKGTNPNEAAVAAAQAAAIMERYKLEVASVEVERGNADLDMSDDEEIECFDRSFDVNTPTAERFRCLFEGARVPTWKINLADGLGRANDCEVVYTSATYGGRKGKIKVVGRPSDVAILRYMFKYVEREVERLTQEYKKAGVIAGHTELNNFRLGAVATVCRTVREQRMEARRAYVEKHGEEKSATALVKVDQRFEETKLALKRFFPRLAHASRQGGALDGGSYMLGRQAGASINVRTGLTGSSGAASPKALRGK